MTQTAATAPDITWVGIADIVKVDKNPDGSRTVTGVMSSPKPDLDRQVMDPTFLKRAATEWFTQRANIREMHQPLAVGKGKELVEDPNGFLVLTSKVIEPSTVKKIDEGILSGYSVGIKNARVIRDAAAPNGRIVDGTMVECSLVDYPAAEVGKFTIAKAANPDDDTGAVALTDDELKAVDADLTQAPEVPVVGDDAARGEAAGEAAKAVSTAGAGASPAAATNLSRDTLRAAVLEHNPAATAAELDALCDAYDAITTPNQRAGGQGSEVSPDSAAAKDNEAGASAETATNAAASKPAETAPVPERKSMDELWGSLKAALADDTNNSEFRALVADAAKAAMPDAVKAAVEEATKDLNGRVAKLEKAPRPDGPYRGAARTFALNDTVADQTTRTADVAVDPVRVRLEAMARDIDPGIRKAAEAALAAMPVATN